MSQRIPGYRQEDMVAIWKDFVQKTFARTRFKTTFNNSTRNVYRDQRKRLLVLDEWHGHLEVLAFQRTGGEGRHLGTQKLELVAKPSRSGEQPDYSVVLGKFRSGGKHRFNLVGGL